MCTHVYYIGTANVKEKLSVRSATQNTKIQKRYTDAPSTLV